LGFYCSVSTPSDRRFTFNQVAFEYDAVRPTYPEALVEDILAFSSISGKGKILEVGCGSGQATLPFARRGYSMICLDIGPELLKLAAQKCQDFPWVNFFCAAFEDWQPGEERFDLLLSATAFHWISPEIGYPKAASLLTDTGYIALFWNYHPRPYTGFFVDVEEIYREILPDWSDPNSAPALDEDIQKTENEINSTGLFEPVIVKRYPWSRDYTTVEYLKLLNTHSDHYSLDPIVKEHLFRAIGALIEDKFGGRITKPHLSVLFMAKKAAFPGLPN
jgi:SAM-dependent methyltransferase